MKVSKENIEDLVEYFSVSYYDPEEIEHEMTQDMNRLEMVSFLLAFQKHRLVYRETTKAKAIHDILCMQTYEASYLLAHAIFQLTNQSGWCFE